MFGSTCRFATAEVAMMKIDAAYSAVHRLSDGTEVRVRLLRPSDRNKLVAGFRRLSPESRYRRFFAPTPKLSDAMLRRLTQTDDWNHLAILAEAVAGNGGEAIGVARFVRLREAPHTAEVAITVIDAMQRRGLGRLLLETLIEAARERDIHKFRGPVLLDNEPMKLLLRSLDEHATARIEDGLRLYELALPEPLPGALSADPIYRVLKLAAEGLQTVIRSFATSLKRRPRGWARAQGNTSLPTKLIAEA
jgi:GNAT superfamily N-acetyltransferase